MHEELEVGVVTGHPIKQMYLQVKTIFITWMDCRKRGFPCDKWYGVYPKGSEKLLAQTGCMPDAESRAFKIKDALSNR